MQTNSSRDFGPPFHGRISSINNHWPLKNHILNHVLLLLDNDLPSFTTLAIFLRAVKFSRCPRMHTVCASWPMTMTIGAVARLPGHVEEERPWSRAETDQRHLAEAFL